MIVNSFIGMMVAPGNSFWFKKYIERELTHLIVRSLMRDLNSLGKFLEELSGESVPTLYSRDNMNEVRPHIESILACRNRQMFDSPTYQSIFTRLQNVAESLQKMLIFQEGKDCSYTLWALMAEDGFQVNSFVTSRLCVKSSKTGGNGARKVHLRHRGSVIRMSLELL